MPLIVFCPSCKTRLTVGDDRAGTTFECPRCATAITVPALLPPPAPPLPPSAPPPLPRPSAQPRRPPRRDYEPDYEDDEDDEDDYALKRRRHRRGQRNDESGAGSVCSILSVIFGSIAFLLCPPLFGLAGLTLGIIGTVISKNKTLGIIGIVLSVVGCIFGMMLGLLMFRL